MCSDGTVGADPDLFITGQNRNLDLIFLGLGVHELVVDGKGPEDGVGVAFLGIGDAKFERRCQNVSTADDGAANGGFQPKIVVSVNRDDQRSRHSCAPPFGIATAVLSFKPL